VFTAGKAAIMDSGTSLIVGPFPDVHGIANQVGAIFSPQDGLFLLDCITTTDLPNLNFELGGKTYSLTPDDYILQDDANICILALMPQRFPVWILGDIFMRKFVTVFDYSKKRVGLAVPVGLEGSSSDGNSGMGSVPQTLATSMTGSVDEDKLELQP